MIYRIPTVSSALHDLSVFEWKYAGIYIENPRIALKLQLDPAESREIVSYAIRFW